MPRRASERPAAYTRTRHLDRFLDQVSSALPGAVDASFVERRLGLSGGDVRAFLQSLRVLGLIDAFGRPTERLRRARARDQRGTALQEGLQEAYPELVARWESRGGLSREETEDHFKVVYGLGATSAEPAAKLFLDVWNREGSRQAGVAPGGPDRRRPLEIVEAASKGGEVRSRLESQRGSDAVREARDVGDVTVGARPRPDIAQLLAGLVHIEIGRDWDADRINLVFDRLERLIARLEGG